MLSQSYQIQRDRAALIRELEAAGAEVRRDGREIKCPWHDDNTASAGIFVSRKDGNFKFKCQPCGALYDVFDVYAENNNCTVREAIERLTGEKPQSKNYSQKQTQSNLDVKTPKRIYPSIEKLREAIEWTVREDSGRITNEYPYTNPETKNLDLIVFRVEFPKRNKSFRQAHQVEGGFIMSGPDGKWPLFNRIRLLSAPYAIVCEGEKAVTALTKLGFVATTAPGGAGKSDHCDWTPLAGKAVIFWPDNDQINEKGKRTGLDHMLLCADECEKLTPPCKRLWIDPDLLDLPPKGDAVEYIAKFADKSNDEVRLAIQALIDSAEEMGIAAAVKSQLEDAIMGRRRAIPMPWNYLSANTKAFLPGTVTILCGPGGATKSIMALEIMRHIHENGYPFAIMELEEDRVFHVRRLLAILSENSFVTDDDWCRDHADAIRSIYERFKDYLEAFGRSLFEFPDAEISSDALLRWLEERAQAGCRVICIDPITAMSASDKGWIDDHRFLIKAKQIMRNYGASLLLITHPKKGATGSGKSSVDDMAGGATYQRFSQTIMWIETKPDEEVGQFLTPSQEHPSARVNHRYNRLIQIRKARNGRGAGKAIGFRFDGSKFKSSEIGIHVKTKDVVLPGKKNQSASSDPPKQEAKPDAKKKDDSNLFEGDQ